VEFGGDEVGFVDLDDAVHPLRRITTPRVGTAPQCNRPSAAAPSGPLLARGATTAATAMLPESDDIGGMPLEASVP
jgi:hypothetical protein